jgi:uncharacterized membrane protein
MTYIERSIEINAPVEKVFQFAADWKNWHEFFEGVSDFRPTTETKRGNGSRFAYKAKLLGMKAPVETEIQEFVENEGWTGVSVKGVESKTRWIFVQVNGKTKFTYGLSYSLPIPILGNVLDRLFVKPAWESIIENSLQNLKERMELKPTEELTSA